MDLEYANMKLEELIEYTQKNNANEIHSYYHNKLVQLKRDLNEDTVDNDLFELLKELGAYMNDTVFQDTKLSHVMCELMMIRAVLTFRD